jgi:predicted short-subunit dehydrogenase-like oxidoreductase (DUF2520 family)
MKVAVIGCGRVGSGLALAIANRRGAGGLRFTGAYSRARSRARSLVRRCGCGRAFPTLLHAAASADILLICVSDGAVAEVGRALGEAADLRRKIVLHTSGVLDLSPLRSLARRGAAIGSLHPLAVFPPARSTSPAILFSIPVAFTVDGGSRAALAAVRIVRSLGGFTLPRPRSRAAYHLVAAMMANHVTVLMALSLDLLRRRAGIGGARARRALATLLRTAADRIEAIGPETALTGPAARGDLLTLRRHLDVLTGERPILRDVYRILSAEAVRIAVRRGDLDSRTATRALRLLRR